jgi:hypothetical protein
MIGQLTKETGCQVFSTTHSYECVDGAVESLGTQDGEEEQLAVIRLSYEHGEAIPFLFDDDSLQYAISKDIEVR